CDLRMRVQDAHRRRGAKTGHTPARPGRAASPWAHRSRNLTQDAQRCRGRKDATGACASRTRTAAVVPRPATRSRFQDAHSARGPRRATTFIFALS
ncbi:hypothetical protein HWV62_1779, partial [Athelia sp. TMB]